MLADETSRTEILELIHRTFAGFSTPGSDFSSIFVNESIAATGSALSDILVGADALIAAGASASNGGRRWTAGDTTIWRNGDTAWAQILGSCRVQRDGQMSVVPYWMTAVFVRSSDVWEWVYFGGSEPQEHPRA